MLRLENKNRQNNYQSALINPYGKTKYYREAKRVRFKSKEWKYKSKI